MRIVSSADMNDVHATITVTALYERIRWHRDLRCDDEAQLFTRAKEGAARLNGDIDRYDFPFVKQLGLLPLQDRLPGRRTHQVQLTPRDLQQTARNHVVVVTNGSVETHATTPFVDFVDGDEHSHVSGELLFFGFEPEPQCHVSGDFGVVRKQVLEAQLT